MSIVWLVLFGIAVALLIMVYVLVDLELSRRQAEQFLAEISSRPICDPEVQRFLRAAAMEMGIPLKGDTDDNS